MQGLLLGVAFSQLYHPATAEPVDLQASRHAGEILKHDELVGEFELGDLAGEKVPQLLQGDLGPSFQYPDTRVNDLVAAGLPVDAM